MSTSADEVKRRIEDERNRIGGVLDYLRRSNDFWHRTSTLNLEKIVRRGAILPSGSGIDVTYPQSKSSYGAHLRAVSLFDFSSSTEDSILEHGMKWVPFLVDQKPITAVLRLKRSAFEGPKLLLSDQLVWGKVPLFKTPAGNDYFPTIIPAVEVLYCDLIPIEWISEVMIVQRGERFTCEIVSLGELIPELYG